MSRKEKWFNGLVVFIVLVGFVQCLVAGLDWNAKTATASSTKLVDGISGKKIVMKYMIINVTNATKLYFHDSDDDIVGNTFDLDAKGSVYVADGNGLGFEFDDGEDAYIWFENDPGCTYVYKYSQVPAN